MKLDVHRRQTERQTNATENTTSLAKEVITLSCFFNEPVEQLYKFILEK